MFYARSVVDEADFRIVSEKRRASSLLATRIPCSERTRKLQLLQNLKQKENTLKHELQVFADKGK